ncbi:uncharacterized protein N7503_001738 [Penicillium pulvis]|uniref:uncharacterized protein n=1 Tax=Penicillium pulvis TaxID=1562058 RepID=UPI0025476065|nr:uncharacterized protein N7503_001738 [Penicillium pulvis]KAJ5809520.1 hypothetical protein N7503_001738 [Penicillium pulvis]
MILDYGFDPSNIASPLFQRWPQPLSPNWIAEEITPDPFFIEYLAMIADSSPGFAGATALHDAVILQSIETVSRLSTCSNKLKEDQNFLGQTLLHLASVNMEITRMLLDAGHDMNTADKYGITPLMYAAGMGNSQVVQMLIRQGADTFKAETRYKRDFISYASVRGHWQLIFESLDTIRSCYTERCFHYFVIDAIMALISRDCLVDELDRTAHFEKLIGLCDDVNFTFDIEHSGTRHNNLLHLVKNRREAHALLCRGLKNFNQENSDRKLAIHSIAQLPNPELIQFCLENGSNVNYPYNDGRTCLVHLISALSDFNWLVWDTIDSIKLCLARGADIFLSDNCECACVSDGNGCHTSSAFNLRLDSRIFCGAPGIMWAFEWLSIVEEFEGQEASKSILLSFVRRTQADIVDIAHLCCHGGKGVNTRDWGLFGTARPSKEDAREILDDEAELFDMLEKDMQPWMQQSFKEVRSQWMNLLKEKHQKMIKEARENRAGIPKEGVQNEACEVDYKNDRFVRSITVGLPEAYSPLSLSTSMAEYAFWLQHEYFRSKTRMESITKEGWYERRMSWFRELKDIMQVRDSEIVNEMFRIDITESRSEKVDQKAIIEHFRAFLKSTVSENVDRIV